MNVGKKLNGNPRPSLLLLIRFEKAAKPRRSVTIRDLPDVAIKAILTQYFLDPSTDRSAFEVCKRFSKLGRHLILKKLVIRTVANLDSLVCGPHSPLYDENASHLIEEVELAVLPTKNSLRSWKPPRHFSLPNLQVVRFSFRYGLYLSGDNDLEGDSIIPLLLSQMMHNKLNANQLWQCFLSQLNPLSFEWTCPPGELENFRLVEFSNLRSVFNAWKRLQLVVLDRICLIELHDLNTNWTIGTPASQVTIKGPMSGYKAELLYDTGRIWDSRLCSSLVFEDTLARITTGTFLGAQMPIVSMGHTVVSVKNCNFWLYQRLIRRLAGIWRWNTTQYLAWRSIQLNGVNPHGQGQPESGPNFSYVAKPPLLSQRGIAISLLFLFLVVFSRRPEYRVEDEADLPASFHQTLGPFPEVDVVSFVVGTEPDAEFLQKGGRYIDMPVTSPPSRPTILPWNPLRLHGGLL